MTLTPPYGFRIVGHCRNERRLVDWATAFRGYCDCDARAEVNCEAYLSAFAFGAEFRALLESTGSTAGYSGACWSEWLWFDLDSDDDLQYALHNAQGLSAWLCERYRLDGDALLLFFSGSKGFHLGLPTALWAPKPSSMFHRACRSMAGRLAGEAAVEIDAGVYDRVRAFRAPNSRHPKTGRHKRRLTFDELLGLPLCRIVKLAATPAPFDLPDPPPPCIPAIDDWRDAVETAEREAAAVAERHASKNGAPHLNRQTLEFIRDGAAVGDRHRLLFSAAANLAELGCPPALAYALLTEAALDSGLPPRDVRRQIDCGLNQAGTAG